MTTVETPLLETLIENLIETSLRLQGSLKGGVPESINRDVMGCGELLEEIRHQTAVAELIAPQTGSLRSRLGYLKEILDANYLLIRQGTEFGAFALGTIAGEAPAGAYSGSGRREETPPCGAVLDTRG